MQASHGIAGIMVRELRRLVSRPLDLWCMVAAPLLCCLFFITLVDEGVPKGIPVGGVGIAGRPRRLFKIRGCHRFTVAPGPADAS